MPQNLEVDPDRLRDEANKWNDLASKMAEIRGKAADLYLGLAAFFPGGMTEVPHWLKYQSCLDEIVHRLAGGAVEFELIGMTLDRIATDYEERDEVNAQSFRVTEEELRLATEEHVPSPPPAVGPNYYQ